MVDEAETPKVLEELSKSNSAPVRKSSDRQKRTALKRVAIFLAFMSPVVVAVLILVYQQWNTGRELNRLASLNDQLSSDLASAQSQIRQLEVSLEQQASAPVIDDAVIEQLRRDFSTETDRLNALLGALQNRLSTGQQGDDGRWHLIEAEQLARIANQQLQLTSNVPVAISILESADRVLADSGDSRVFPVRQALGRDMTALRLVDTVDTEGLYIRLSSLKESVAQVLLNESAQDLYRRSLASSNQLESSDGQTGDSLIASSFNFLNSVFVWRKWEDSPDVVFQPQQGIEVKRNINLMLEQAQLALMMRQPDIYRESLARSKVWIEQYLSEMAAGTQPLIAELDSLLAVDLNPALPDLSQTLGLIRQVRSNLQSESQ